jgi:hypothetical protein
MKPGEARRSERTMHKFSRKLMVPVRTTSLSPEDPAIRPHRLTRCCEGDPGRRVRGDEAGLDVTLKWLIEPYRGSK